VGLAAQEAGLGGGQDGLHRDTENLWGARRVS